MRLALRRDTMLAINCLLLSRNLLYFPNWPRTTHISWISSTIRLHSSAPNGSNKLFDKMWPEEMP